MLRVPPRYRTISAVTGTVSVAILAAVWLFAPRGLLVTYRVASESMVPTLFGPHYLATCPACGFPARWNGLSEVDSERSLARCPNCRSEEIANQTAKRMPGDRVWLEPRWRDLVTLERFDIVAYENERAEFGVKRIAGLPGEEISLGHGELRVNDRLLRKSADEFQRVAILVHDDSYRRAGAATASAWSSHEPTSTESSHKVTCEADGFQFSSTGAADSVVPWLIYHHRNHHGLAGPITDDYYQNTHVARPLNFVHDIAVTAQIEPTSAGTWLFGLHDGDHDWVIRWTPRSRGVTVENQGVVVASQSVPTGGAVTDRGQLWVAMCDFQLLLSIDGRPLLRWEYPEAYPRSKPPSTPLRLAWQGRGTAHIRQLRVWRDWYLFHPQRLEEPWQRRAGASSTGYFLLGDNLPVSADGRTNPRAGSLPPHSLLGRPRVVSNTAQVPPGGGG